MSRNKDDVEFNRDIQPTDCQLEVSLVPLSLLRTNLLRILKTWPIGPNDRREVWIFIGGLRHHINVCPGLQIAKR